MEGERIKEVRNRKGYTLQELADKTGITASYISQIERGIRHPSLGSLRKIAECLEVPVLAFMINNDDSFIIRKQNRKTTYMPEIETEYQFITPISSDENIKPNMVGLYAKLEPGKWVSEKLISHSGQESILVLKGEIEVHLYDQVARLKEGDSFYIRENIPHNILCSGKEESISIHYFSPPIY